jgi:Ca2+-transporting ATPase
MAFSVLALSPLVHAFNARSSLESILRQSRRNRFLWGAVGVSAAVHLLAVAIPALQPVFKTTGLDTAQWGIVLALSLVPLPAVELAKACERWLRASRRGATSKDAPVGAR